MKKLIVIATLLFVTATSASAETVRTCSSVYGGGEVCGESTINQTVEHQVIATGEGDNQMIKTLGSIAIAALVATALYKLTYKSYIFG
jgi:hypothetical protein